MKTINLILAIAVLAAGQLPALDITTKAGTTYTDCEVTKVESDKILVRHSGGLARISFEQLPSDLQIKYGYDAVKVAEQKKRMEEAAAAEQRRKDDAEQARIDQAQKQADQEAAAVELAAQETARQEEAAAERRAKAERSSEIDAVFSRVLRYTLGTLFVAVSLGIYFFPTIIAQLRRKRNVVSIFVLNLCLGWTFLGWVVALVWAFGTERVDLARG